MLLHQLLDLLLIIPSKLSFFVLFDYLESMSNVQLGLAFFRDAHVLASENQLDALLC